MADISHNGSTLNTGCATNLGAPYLVLFTTQTELVKTADGRSVQNQPGSLCENRYVSIEALLSKTHRWTLIINTTES